MKNGLKKSRNIMNHEVVDVKGWKSIGNRLDKKLRMSGFKFEDFQDEGNLPDETLDIAEESNNVNQTGENLTLF